MRLTHRHVFAVVTFVLAACSSYDATPAASTGPGNESKLILTLSAQADTIPEATSKTLTARVTDVTGFLKAVPVTWSSTDPNIASVSNGLVTGVSRGVTSVIASASGATDTALIVVTENDIVLDVQPSAAAVAMGDTVNFVATMRTRSGDIVRVNSFKWAASDTTAAQFVGDGLLRTKHEGELSVSAEAMMRQGNSTVKIFKSPAATVTISPSTANLYQGSSIALVVTLRDQNGRLVEGDVKFGSSDYTKATVDNYGVVTGVGVGSVVITATADRKTGSATINVMSPPATSLQLSFPSPSLVVGDEMQATATATDASGAPLLGKTIAYQSANPSIATVTNTGVVKGIAEGTVKMSAIVDGVVASSNLSVKGAKATALLVSPTAPSVSIGQQSQLVAQVIDQDGNVMSGQAVAWSTSNPATATVSASGVLQGNAVGSVTITATSGALVTAVTATVVSAPVAAVRITPSSASVEAGKTTSLTAEALDANMSVLPGRSVSWASQNPSIATVNNSGVVTAIASGSTVLTATIEGKSAGATITVTAAPLAPVATISVSLAATALSPGQTTQATATLRDASGNVVTGRSLLWFSLDTAVAKVSATGVVTAIGGGTVAIMANSEGKSGSASLTVSTPTAAPVASVTLDVSTQDLKVGESVQTVVTLYDASGNVLTGRTITYASDNPAVVSVTASGVVNAIGAGTTKIKVSSGTATTQETFRVTGTSVASISVTPSSSTLNVGQSAQLSAVAKDAQGSTLSGTTFTWVSSNTAVATVTASGVVTAVSIGSATVSALAAGVTGSMALTVSSSPTSNVVAFVSVSLSSSSLLVGGTSQATAVARNSSGVTLSGKTVSWSVASTSLASVSSSGLVTALASGTVAVKATVDGITGSSDLTIAAPLAPPSGSTIVELPRTYLNFSYPARTGQSIVVPAGGNLQTAINNAQRGDEIVLTAGATYTGNFVLPTKAGTSADGWIVIRSDKSGQLPAIGTRVSPTHASLMAKIETPSVDAAIKTAGATSGWWLVGLEVTVSPSLTAQQYGLISFGDTYSQTSLSTVPFDLVLDRSYVHGQTTTNMSRCIALNSARSQVSDNYITECHGRDFDSQAIWGGNGPGPYKIVNNMLAGAGENIMFGGYDPKIAGLVPSDIEIRRNHIYTPFSWKGTWQRKNLFELKNASRVLVEGNVLENSWADAQTGWAVVITSANQDGNCRWCRTTDVTMRRNLIKNAGAGISIAAKAYNTTDTTTRRILISENTLENIGVSPFNDGDRRGFQLLKGTTTITIERVVLAGSLGAAMYLDESPGSTAPVFRESVWIRGDYGIIATGTGSGTQALDSGAPGYSWTNMTMVGTSNGTYPSGTTWVGTEGSSTTATQIRAAVTQAISGVVIP